MMKNKNHIRTMYTRDKGWRLFGLAPLAIQILFIGANYLAMMS
ncbi:KGW motif small protein [Acinetobacter baumannii]